MGNASQGRRDSGFKKEHSVGRMSEVMQRATRETKSEVEGRGTPFSKLEFTDFDGSNLEDWVYHCERYFELEQTAQVKKVMIYNSIIHS